MCAYIFIYMALHKNIPFFFSFSFLKHKNGTIFFFFFFTHQHVLEVRPCPYTQLYLILLDCCIVFHSLFIKYSPPEGHLGCFQFFPGVRSAAVPTFVYVSLCTRMNLLELFGKRTVRGWWPRLPERRGLSHFHRKNQHQEPVAEVAGSKSPPTVQEAPCGAAERAKKVLI